MATTPCFRTHALSGNRRPELKNYVLVLRAPSWRAQLTAVKGTPGSSSIRLTPCAFVACRAYVKVGFGRNPARTARGRSATLRIGRRPAAVPRKLDLGLLSDLQRIVDIDPKVADGAFELGMAE